MSGALTLLLFSGQRDAGRRPAEKSSLPAKLNRELIGEGIGIDWAGGCGGAMADKVDGELNRCYADGFGELVRPDVHRLVQRHARRPALSAVEGKCPLLDGGVRANDEDARPDARVGLVVSGGWLRYLFSMTELLEVSCVQICMVGEGQRLVRASCDSQLD